MTDVRRSWAKRVGQPSHHVVKLHIEAFVSQYSDSLCHIRGTVSVPGPPAREAERQHLAELLLGKTALPALRPNFAIRILEMTSTRFDTLRHVVEVEDIRMPRFMSWEMEYIENRYMRALPMKDMKKRTNDILNNSYDITEGGKLGLRTTTSQVEWMRYFQHVLTEAKMRGLPYPLFLDKHFPMQDDGSFIASVKGDHSTRAAGAVTTWLSDKTKEFHVIKYGEYRHMERFLTTGEMLIRSSRGFEEHSFNEARRDDENSISLFGVRMIDGTTIPAYDVPDWSSQDQINVFSASMDQDYMLYCMAGTLSPTLFSHFGRSDDACVVIHDIDAFVQRVRREAIKSFPEDDFNLTHGTVTYIDPLGAIPPTPLISEKSELSIPFLKHFRHTYQDEYRFAWVPRTPAKQRLSSEKIWIGCLDDIAEIIQI